MARGGAALLVADATFGISAARIERAPRDDVDDAVDGVRAPHGRPGAADHLDALDVLEQRVRRVPKHAGEERCVDSATVDQDEELVTDRVIESACADCVLARVDARHFQVRREPQSLGQAGHARSPNVISGDDEQGRRRIRQALGAAGNRRDFQVGEFFETEIGKLCGSPRLRRSQAGQARKDNDRGAPRVPVPCIDGSHFLLGKLPNIRAESG